MGAGTPAGGPSIVAHATDAPLAVPAPLPTLDPNSPDDIASYVVGSMMGGAGARGAE